jgi:hypothetical protein
VDHADPHEVHLAAQQDVAVIGVMHHFSVHVEQRVSAADDAVADRRKDAGHSATKPSRKSAVIDMLRTAQ